MTQKTIDGNVDPIGFQQIDGMVASTALTPPTGADIALIQAEDQNVRWRDDTTAPTTGIGIQLSAGQDFWYTGNLATIRFIQETATAKLNISYYKV